jgi:hypothetical protein
MRRKLRRNGWRRKGCIEKKQEEMGEKNYKNNNILML